MSLFGTGRLKDWVGGVRVMSDEWGDLSVRACHGDTPIDPASEIGESILEVVMGNLHNV